MRRMIAAGPPAKRPPHITLRGSTGWSPLFATIGLVLLLALPSAGAAEEEQIKLGEFIPATPPQPAPEAAFTDLEGKPVSLADFKGRPALVNLWATWCEPCLKEMPSLDRLQVEFADKLVVAAISEDRAGAKLVVPFVDKMSLKKLAIYLDPKSDMGHALHVRGLPTSIVLDAAGLVVGKVEGGAEWDSEKMLAVLRPLLEGPANPLKKAAR